MTDAAFLAAVLDSPDDDGPRLVWADTLDERGEPRGEWIRVGCEMESLNRRIGRSPCRHCDLEVGHVCDLCFDYQVRWERARELRQTHGLLPLLGLTGDAWSYFGLIPGPNLQVSRGFVEGVTLPIGVYLDCADRLHATQPLRAVTLTRPWPPREQGMPRGGEVSSTCRKLWRSPHVGRLRRLDLSELFADIEDVTDHRNWSIFLTVRRDAFRPWRGLNELVVPAGIATRADRNELARSVPGLTVSIPEDSPTELIS